MSLFFIKLKHPDYYDQISSSLNFTGSGVQGPDPAQNSENMYLQGASVWDSESAWLCSACGLPLHLSSCHWVSLWQVWQWLYWLYCPRPGTELLLLQWTERVKNNGHSRMPNHVLKDRNTCTHVPRCNYCGSEDLIPWIPALPAERGHLGTENSGVTCLTLFTLVFLSLVHMFYSILTHRNINGLPLRKVRSPHRYLIK